MAFRLVSSGGNVNDPVLVNMAASGEIHPGLPVELVLSTTGAVVAPAGIDTTRTLLFGVAYDHLIGASDSYVRVVRFNPEQLWEVDCANAITTAQVGVRQYLSASRGYVHNQVTDANGINRVFLAVAMTGSTSGSGKLIGHFLASPGL